MEKEANILINNIPKELVKCVTDIMQHTSVKVQLEYPILNNPLIIKCNYKLSIDITHPTGFSHCFSFDIGKADITDVLVNNLKTFSQNIKDKKFCLICIPDGFIFECFLNHYMYNKVQFVFDNPEKCFISYWVTCDAREYLSKISVTVHEMLYILEKFTTFLIEAKKEIDK